MKNILILIVFIFCAHSFANETPPDYLKDGTITVTLKSGKTHTYSTNEYMVVKRGKKQAKVEKEPVVARKVEKNQKRLKHIVSGEVLESSRGLSESTNATSTTVRNRRKLGLGIQYQYNVYDDLFLGGRIDSNGGAGLNLGVGF